MHFLCLHGLGTSSEILESQIASISSGLEGHTFYFADGEVECPPAEGIGSIFPAPYLCYYVDPTVENVTKAHQLLEAIIEEEGPFDAVLGFSQGAALAASYILHCEAESKPVPFNLAVFICTSLPFSITPEFGVDITDMFPTGPSPEPVPASVLASRPENIFVPSHDLSARGKDRSTASSNAGKTIEEGDRIRRFHPAFPAPKIPIATAHIYGKQDPYFSQGATLKELCNPEKTVSYEHPEGHLVPRGEKVTRSMVTTIEKAIKLSQV